MLGPYDDQGQFIYQQRGLIPRILDYLFECINAEKKKVSIKFFFSSLYLLTHLG